MHAVCQPIHLPTCTSSWRFFQHAPKTPKSRTATQNLHKNNTVLICHCVNTVDQQ